MLDSAAVIRELVKRRRCALFTVEMWTVPVTLDSAEQTAMVMFRGMAAQWELKRIRSRTRDGLRQRARDGLAFGTVHYGYKTVLVDPSVTERKKSKKQIEIDDGALGNWAHGIRFAVADSQFENDLEKRRSLGCAASSYFANLGPDSILLIRAY